MTKMIFISLPIKDLAVSKAFYEALGFEYNPQYSDDKGACMIWSESIYVMILTHEKWHSFTDRPIPPEGSSEVALNISCDSREEVDAMNVAAAGHGGTCDINPTQDLGFMYGRDLADPDGHIWGPFWMDEKGMPEQA
ncbi:VOC family protein [Neptunicella marina]|uniref:Lactoylglutathione lyase n=1 Tax=Neptunicella marina TaxID=2125989 RepID=A0A8J6ITU5_9ALTE|nr:VOC family protein [Neptunicella marina]MBC3766214.1 lactoylglutathione lyase [Neptunicella marina]